MSFRLGILAFCLIACSGKVSGSPDGGNGSGSSDGGNGSGSPDTGGVMTVDAGPSSALDGTWKATMLPPELIGAPFKDGQIVIHGGSVTATFDYADVGTNTGGCLVMTHQSVTQLTIQGKIGTGTISESATYSGCPPLSDVIATLTIQQTTAKPPTLTPYDGAWSIALAGDAPGVITLTIANGQWQAAAMGVMLATGMVANGVATATDSVSDFAAQRQ